MGRSFSWWRAAAVALGEVVASWAAARCGAMRVPELSGAPRRLAGEAGPAVLEAAALRVPVWKASRVVSDAAPPAAGLRCFLGLWARERCAAVGGPRLAAFRRLFFPWWGAHPRALDPPFLYLS